MSHGLAGGILRHHLRRVSGAFARAFESDFARARPADHVARQIGDGDDGVVESGKDMRDAGVNVLAALGLDDLRLLDVVRIERKIFLRRLGGGWRFFFGFRRLSSLLWQPCGAAAAAAAVGLRLPPRARCFGLRSELSGFAGFGFRPSAFAGFLVFCLQPLS